MQKDRNIGWNRGRKFFYPRTMAGVLDDGTSGVPTSLGAGNPGFAEIAAALELSGMPLDLNDEVYHFWPIPWYADMDDPLRFRIWFAHTTTDADSPIFQIAYKFVAKQAAITDAKSSPDQTLTFDAHTVSTTDNSLEITNWKESTSHNSFGTTDFALLFALTMNNLGSAGADEIILLGTEVEFTVGAAPNERQLRTLSAPPSGTGPNI
jgi:hypothetical protein